MTIPQLTAAAVPTATANRKKRAAEQAMMRLKKLYSLCRSRRLVTKAGAPGMLGATLSVREVRSMFDDEDLAERYPVILTYAQAAELVQVSQETLKGWFCQGKFAQCVRRGKPARVLRDCFVQKFLADEYKVNDE